MNADDVARLALAKRAYEAARPRAGEVQNGVRRARLSLRRPKTRRNWLSKGLVVVVLAVGSLAYAKPHAVGELVQRVFAARKTPAALQAGTGAGAAPAAPRNNPGSERSARHVSTFERSAGQVPASAPIRVITDEALPSSTQAPPSSTQASPSSTQASPSSTGAPPSSARRSSAPVSTKASSSSRTHGAAKSPAAQSLATARGAGEGKSPGWGRVGRALAQGDEAAALAALGELSRTGDDRTRDKAELGRAQLLLASGERARACEVARALTERQTQDQIARQAQALLGACSR